MANWLRNVIWTNEAHFTLRASDNFHNCRIMATKDSRTFFRTPFHEEKVTVRCGFAVSTIIGPFFFEEMRDSYFKIANLTGGRFADILQNHIIHSLSDKHLLESPNLRQDGAPPDIARK